MNKEKFIDTYTSKANNVIIGMKTSRQLEHLLHLLTKFNIEHPSSFILGNLRIALATNKGVGLLLKISSFGGTAQWSYTSSADTIRGEYIVKWFNAVKTDILEGDKL